MKSSETDVRRIVRLPDEPRPAGLADPLSFSKKGLDWARSVLRLQPAAGKQECVSEYKKLSLSTHPDKHGNDLREQELSKEAFQKVVRAKEIVLQSCEGKRPCPDGDGAGGQSKRAKTGEAASSGPGPGEKPSSRDTDGDQEPKTVWARCQDGGCRTRMDMAAFPPSGTR